MSVAFYPCCGRDFEFAGRMILPFATSIVFCDRSKSYLKEFQQFRVSYPEIDCDFVVGDARDVVHRFDHLSVFFHRGVVAPGEGSADIFFFGKKYFSVLAPRFLGNGVIISDGNGEGDKIFQRMLRPQGYTRFGRHFAKLKDFPQPDESGLFRISVKKLGE
jgi:hypothetical protein